MFRTDRFAALRGLAVLLAAVLLFALLAVACGGENGEGETPKADDTPAAGETPAADETPAEGETPAAADDEGLQELETLAGQAAEGIIAKVTYRFSNETNGAKTEGEWVLVQRPPDSRFEFTSTEGGQESRFIIITAGGKSYMCTSTAGQESCLATEAEEAEAQTAPLDALFSIPQELAEDTEGVDITDTSQRKIAGVDATCFTVTSTLVDLGEGETCFSDEGLLLYVRSEATGTSTEFEATSVSTDVTDADFEPPYEIVELPDLQQ